MMMKRSTTLAGALLAACSQQPANQIEPADTPTPATETTQPAAGTSPTSAATAPSTIAHDSGQAGKLPPADNATPRYVGRWATSEQLCKSGAWRFSATHVETAGEISCQYDRVDKVPGGYDLHAMCTAEAPPKPDTIKLRFAESAQAMLVESKVLPSVGLVYCGALE